MVRFRLHRLNRPWPLAALALAFALMVGAGALVASWVSGPTQLGAAPADLQVPPNLGDDLHQWCIDRQAQGTSGLSSAAKSWLRACIEASTPTGNPGPTGTQNPTAGPTANPSGTAKPPTTTTANKPSGPCPVGGKNVPGAADPWGGCFPGPGNTGVPAGKALSAYTGPCTITVANTVIDSKTVTCSILDIRATGVVIRNSMLQNTDLTDDNSSTASFTIVDSAVVNGAREQCNCVGGHDFTMTRVEVRGGNRSAYCELRCTVTDSWLHGQILEGAQHGSGLREEQYTTATHNTFECSYPFVNDSTSLGCSAPQNGYADFAPIHNNINKNNLYVSTRQGSCSTCDPSHTNSSYCAYGGDSQGKPFSGDPSNGTHIQYLSNVFQRGPTGVCGDYQTVGNFSRSKPGNVATGNLYDDGSLVPASQIGE